MSNNVKLQVLLRAVDQASRPFKSIRTASKSLSGDIRETQKSLRELNGHASRIEGFRKTSAQLAVTGHALEKARQEAEALATQFKNTERSTRAQAKVLESAKRAAEDLQAKYNRLTDSVKRQQRELAAVGINTRNLAHDEQGLKNRISKPPHSLTVSATRWRVSVRNRQNLTQSNSVIRPERNWPEIWPQWALPVWGLRRRERWPELSC